LRLPIESWCSQPDRASALVADLLPVADVFALEKPLGPQPQAISELFTYARLMGCAASHASSRSMHASTSAAVIEKLRPYLSSSKNLCACRRSLFFRPRSPREPAGARKTAARQRSASRLASRHAAQASSDSPARVSATAQLNALTTDRASSIYSGQGSTMRNRPCDVPVNSLCLGLSRQPPVLPSPTLAQPPPHHGPVVSTRKAGGGGGGGNGVICRWQ
jgi:hypothetical protein